MRSLEFSNRTVPLSSPQNGQYLIGFGWRLVGLTVMLLIGGCGAERESPATRELRIAINPWPGYSLIYLAEEEGFFRDEGLTVRLIEMASLADARRVFEHGQADLICCTLVEVLMMNEASGTHSVQCISACDYSNGSDKLIASSDISTLEALRGRRIGLEPESVDCLAVYLALESVGLSINDVTIVPLAQSEMLEALRLGEVDAVQTYPPGSDAVSRIPGAHTVWDSSDAPGVILDVIAAHASLLADQPELVRGLLRAYRRAQEFYQEQPQAALAVLTRRCGLDEEALLRYLRGMKILTVDEPEALRIFDAEGAREVTARVAEGLVAAGLLRATPRQPPFDGRFVGPPTL